LPSSYILPLSLHDALPICVLRATSLKPSLAALLTFGSVWPAQRIISATISLGFFLLASTRMVAATSRSFQSLLLANFNTAGRDRRGSSIVRRTIPVTSDNLVIILVMC